MIHKIALTGGPGGGKTTALPLLTKHFTDKGFKVYTVPEVATLMHMNGVDLGHKVRTTPYDLEHSVVRMQLAMEDGFNKLALSDGKSLIICDRGAGDFKAYCPAEMWDRLLADFGLTQDSVYNRYDAVVHLTTAAIGAEAFFTNENNPARNCTPGMARHLDRKTLEAWNGHTNLIEVDNTTDFAGKIRRAVEFIERAIEGHE